MFLSHQVYGELKSGLQLVGFDFASLSSSRTCRPACGVTAGEFGSRRGANVSDCSACRLSACIVGEAAI
jgi:hypothetical protein